ncbi:MAG: class I SAM-dependent methyltransferase [Dehalococcoidia bacterium]
MFDKAHNSRKKGNIPNSQTCNVCRNELITFYSKVQDPITNEIFAIFKCTKCGLGHTLPHPENLKKYYDKTYYGNRHGFTQDYCIKRRTKLVFWGLKDSDGKRLLDIGCGDGSFLRAIKESGWDVAGTEINPNLELTGGLIVKENIEELSDCAPFDCITMWHTLEHMPNIRSTLSQINSLLKPSGKLIIAVPNINSFQSKVFKSKWLPLDVPRHQYHFDVPSLQYCLRANGFVVQHQLYQELEYDLLGWTQSALNCILPTPNIFFDILRGKPKIKRKKYSQFNMLLGIFFLLLSIPAVLIERLFNRSGTIITIIIKDVK